jgi:hypothetical protein
MDEMVADIDREYNVVSGERENHWRCRISTGSLTVLMRKYTMALM